MLLERTHGSLLVDSPATQPLPEKEKIPLGVHKMITDINN